MNLLKYSLQVLQFFCSPWISAVETAMLHICCEACHFGLKTLIASAHPVQILATFDESGKLFPYIFFNRDRRAVRFSLKLQFFSNCRSQKNMHENEI